MPRCLASLTVFGLLVGCAATPHLHPEYLATTDSSPRSEPTRVASEATSDAHAPDALWRTDAAFAAEPPALARADSERTQSGGYVMVKGGALEPEDSDFDTGTVYTAAFGHYVNSLLAVEFEGGYLSPDVKGSADVYGVPLLVNARVCVPIWLLELYGGGGLGTMYYDFNSKSVDATGWLAAGDLFIGADIQLFDKVMAGVELKYYITDKLRNTSDNLNALALMLTVGWRF